jgi:hypothetical protein
LIERWFENPPEVTFVQRNIMNVVDKNQVSAKTPVQAKRPYASPILSEYGDIRQITLHTPAGPRGDNPASNNKTT